MSALRGGWGLRAGDALSTMGPRTGPWDAEDHPDMALKKQATPKRWRSKEAKEIVAAVQRAGGQVERTASGHLKVIGPTGAAIVASAPTPAAPVGWRSTTPWPRSGARPGYGCEPLGRRGASGGGGGGRGAPGRDGSRYRYFAVIGGPLEVATVIAAVVFALRARVG